MVSARNSDGLPAPEVLCLGLSTTGVLFSLSRWPALELADGIPRGAASAEPVSDGTAAASVPGL